MAPRITNFSDLGYLAEAFVNNRKDFLFTEFNVIDEDDAVFYGQLKKEKLKISLEEFESALQRVPDEDLYPEVPSDATVAPQDVGENDDALYLKRPRLDYYYDYREQGVLHIIPQMLLDEVNALERVSQQPHPGIIGYHGCRVRRGRITALVLDKHPHDLKAFLKDAIGQIDKDPFMTALESAVKHLHSLGFAHNDINPANILVNADRMPVLIDFGSCREIGQKLGISRGTVGWIQGEDSDYNTSETEHDWYAVEKIRTWLDGPDYDF